MVPITLRSGVNQLPLYTWSDRECCLPSGATRATLETSLVPGLEVGTFLLFEEVLGPRTGAGADADPEHRHVVRLTSVEAVTDPLNGTDLVEIAWDEADALPFPLCISGRTDDAHGAQYIEAISLARGNVVPADHGLSLTTGESLGTVGAEARLFRPHLQKAPLTHAVTLPREGDGSTPPAAEFDQYDPSEALPQIHLRSQLATTSLRWDPQRDLLSSDRFATEFVAEIDDEGIAHLRFGDGTQGREPAEGSQFSAVYRIGNGRAGNVGRDTLTRVVTSQTGIVRVRNPLSATGGRDPEDPEQVRRYAPQAFRVQQRAVTELDYASVAERHPEVQRAAATFRWTGSWYTVFVTIDRRRGRLVDVDFELELRRHLNFFRMAGYDLEVDPPRFVPLELLLQVCVKPDYERSEVRRELLEVFSNRTLPDGRQGFFHPDLWTFGQPLYLSRLYAAAATVEGVESAEVTIFKRWAREEVPDEFEKGVMKMDRLEIVRLDNDPSFQENGLIEFELEGGR
jgi:hypothetical protein